MTWPIVWPNEEEATALDPGAKMLAEMYASAAMDALTLGRVGGGEITVLPDNAPDRWYGTHYFDGRSYPVVYPSAEALRNPERGLYLSELSLPGPVGVVTAVTIGGVAVNPATYQLINGRALVRVDGSPWPVQDGTLVVTYTNSYPVDEMGKRAAGFLAREFALLFANPTGKNRSGQTRLPASVTNVVRQGVTYEVVRGMFPGNVTGLPEVDTYLMMWNPHGLRTRPRVYSPDLSRDRQVWP